MEKESSESREGRVVVGPPPPAGAEPDDVLPAVVRTRSDDSRRYILYSDAPDRDGVAETRLSVDADSVVERELWR
ncbi:hypothetical protein [Halosimplex salinum]|uniref:hypothetical protein n=1 Tax=Halosimplex salinum TaxID=1710538 RepID=UPI000F47F23E|nr:hypothetical protein [Halosimplex salinum]